MSSPQADPEQLATLLDRIAEHGDAESIRTQVRGVADALRGSGFLIVNLPPSKREQETDWEFDRRVRDSVLRLRRMHEL